MGLRPYGMANVGDTESPRWVPKVLPFEPREDDLNRLTSLTSDYIMVLISAPPHSPPTPYISLTIDWRNGELELIRLCRHVLQCFAFHTTMNSNVLHCRLGFQAGVSLSQLAAVEMKWSTWKLWFPAISGWHPSKMCRNAMRGCIALHLHGQGVFFHQISVCYWLQSSHSQLLLRRLSIDSASNLLRRHSIIVSDPPPGNGVERLPNPIYHL